MIGFDDLQQQSGEQVLHQVSLLLHKEIALMVDRVVDKKLKEWRGQLYRHVVAKTAEMLKIQVKYVCPPRAKMCEITVFAISRRVWDTVTQMWIPLIDPTCQLLYTQAQLLNIENRKGGHIEQISMLMDQGHFPHRVCQRINDRKVHLKLFQSAASGTWDLNEPAFNLGQIKTEMHKAPCVNINKG